MINIKKRGDKWRINIKDEEFEFDSRKQMQINLDDLLDMKEKHGNIRQPQQDEDKKW